MYVAKADPSYSAKDITVLEGLEAVRKRPGMYIGSHRSHRASTTSSTRWSTTPWTRPWPATATRIDVTLLADGGCEVTDDGRGIPVDMKSKGKSAAEVVLTVLHAGGKFGGEGYKVSGGLHGVGVSVVNALSERCEVEIDRDGKRHFMDFAKGGKVQTKLKVVGNAPRGRTGTTVRFWPDPTIFDEVDFRAQTLVERLQMMAFLNKGLEIRLKDERDPEAEPVVFRYAGGIVDFVKHVNAVQGGAVQPGRLLRAGRGGHGGGARVPVEHGLQRRRPALLRQRHQHHRGRDARGGVQEGPHQRGQQVRPGQGPAQGEGRQPPGRGHP